MVIRDYIICGTCGTNYTLRIGVGHNPEQKHTLQCTQCHEDMVVKLHVDMKEVATRLECIDNCDCGHEEGIIYNLHPEYVFPGDQIHEDGGFPWFGGLHQLAKKQVELAQKQGIDIENVDFFEVAEEITAIEDLWNVLKKAWNLDKNGRRDLSLKELEKYVDYRFEDKQELDYALFHFCGRLGGPFGYSLFMKGSEFTEKVAIEHEPEYRRFEDFYVENLCEDHLDSYLDIFTEFFREFSEYNQVLSTVQYGLDINEKSVSGSSSFKNTKMFYGNAFEVYTSSLVILACLNNIHSGRKYDEFLSMDLRKYLTTNKARRAEPFKDTGEIVDYAECLDSTLRNASHHKAIRLKGRIVEYRSGGTGAVRSMGYAEYLAMCVRIFLSLCSLLKIELGISFNSHANGGR